MEDNFNSLLSDIDHVIPKERVYTDKLRTFAFGTDASFYRLTPKLVVKVISEEEAIHVIKACYRLNIPITFRASGTSLSGQSISASVLLVADRSWNQIKISDDKQSITLSPATLGIQANLRLNEFNKKIGPDPASINAATVVGIASNNASGMTSGTEKNSYNTLKDLRIIFSDGTLLDTSDQKSCQDFLKTHKDIITEIKNIESEISNNNELKDRIEKKYKIKNTTGYGINSFTDYQAPTDIIKHLMIGAEGTLGFISEITLNTVPSLPNKASSLIIFPSVKGACSAIPILKKLPVDAAEIMDRASLKSVENKKGMPEYLKELNENAAALLIETSAETIEALDKNISEIQSNLKSIETIRPIEFTKIPTEYLKLWKIRKGLFPSVSKSRKPGTTVIIEDVNFTTNKLADAVMDLQNLFKVHDYTKTIIWGHALSGNIHFVFAQDFNDINEVKRYQKFMQDVVKLVVKKYDGSLKAEHGTGRNMAAFVKYEWGHEIYNLMLRIKKAIDPTEILNPGVLINLDELIYIKNIKETPIVNPMIDKCIDCGFCENICPSKNLTLTPRQRIAVWREINRLEKSNGSKEIINELQTSYNYFGNNTCATDGLCELSCPVDIDTGKLIKTIRKENIIPLNSKIADFFVNHFSKITFLLKKILSLVNFIRNILGVGFLHNISMFLRKISNNKIPMWNKFLPKGSGADFKDIIQENNNKEIIYFPSCISRSMGTYSDSKFKEDQSTVFKRLLTKAGFNIIYPKNLNNLCCGMPFSSKGYIDAANKKADELYNSLKEINKKNNIQVVFDTSPCVKTFKEYLGKNKLTDITIYDSVEFIADEILQNLEITKTNEPIAIHSTCSTTKMELVDKLLNIANACSDKVIVPEDINCCGFAGDRGFTFPELNNSALSNLKKTVVKNNCRSGYSSSRTCEIGLSLYSGIEYNSIIYLVDKCSNG
ncbi:MAG: 4Fe-4S ferredoxin [Ignavibacteriae bacterium]|nr:MAG: 4Fe-4S ferredoxin [Ignavibacteriota bacterium]